MSSLKTSTNEVDKLEGLWGRESSVGFGAGVFDISIMFSCVCHKSNQDQ